MEQTLDKLVKLETQNLEYLGFESLVGSYLQLIRTLKNQKLYCKRIIDALQLKENSDDSDMERTLLECIKSQEDIYVVVRVEGKITHYKEKINGLFSSHQIAIGNSNIQFSNILAFGDPTRFSQQYYNRIEKILLLNRDKNNEIEDILPIITNRRISSDYFDLAEALIRSSLLNKENVSHISNMAMKNQQTLLKEFKQLSSSSKSGSNDSSTSTTGTKSLYSQLRNLIPPMRNLRLHRVDGSEFQKLFDDISRFLRLVGINKMTSPQILLLAKHDDSEASSILSFARSFLIALDVMNKRGVLSIRNFEALNNKPQGSNAVECLSHAGILTDENFYNVFNHEKVDHYLNVLVKFYTSGLLDQENFNMLSNASNLKFLNDCLSCLPNKLVTLENIHALVKASPSVVDSILGKMKGKNRFLTDVITQKIFSSMMEVKDKSNFFTIVNRFPNHIIKTNNIESLFDNPWLISRDSYKKLWSKIGAHSLTQNILSFIFKQGFKHPEIMVEAIEDGKVNTQLYVTNVEQELLYRSMIARRLAVSPVKSDFFPSRADKAMKHASIYQRTIDFWNEPLEQTVLRNQMLELFKWHKINTNLHKQLITSWFMVQSQHSNLMEMNGKDPEPLSVMPYRG